MVDISKSFTESFYFLSKNKKIILPVLLSLLIPLILLLSFFYLSGLNPLIQELSLIHDNYKTLPYPGLENTSETFQKTFNTINTASNNDKSTMYSEEFLAYLKLEEYDFGKFKSLINIKNGTLLLVTILLMILSSLYFTTMSYALVTLKLKHKDSKVGKLISFTNSMFWRTALFNIFYGLIIIAPLLVLIAIIFSSFLVNTVLGVIVVIFSILSFFVYILFMCIKLFFVIPAMYIDNSKMLPSVKQSINLTNKNSSKILLAIGTAFAISIFISSFIGQPLNSSFVNFVLETGIGLKIINLFIALLLLVIESFMMTFLIMFLFYMYIDFKKL